VEPDRLSRELTSKLEAARMTAEALSLDAGLARDTVGRWIRGSTLPAPSSLKAVESVLGSRLGNRVDLSSSVRDRRATRQSQQAPKNRSGSSRWTLNHKIAAGATLLVLIALFLPWFDASGPGLSRVGAADVTASGTTVHGWLWSVFVIGLAVLGYLFIVATLQRLPFVVLLKHQQLLLAAASVNLLLILIAFLLKPGSSGLDGVKIGWDFGAYIALIAAIAAVAPLGRAAVSERNAVRPAPK
jgi:hypothetical protein